MEFSICIALCSVFIITYATLIAMGMEIASIIAINRLKEKIKETDTNKSKRTMIIIRISAMKWEANANNPARSRLS